MVFSCFYIYQTNLVFVLQTMHLSIPIGCILDASFNNIIHISIIIIVATRSCFSCIIHSPTFCFIHTLFTIAVFCFLRCFFHVVSVVNMWEQSLPRRGKYHHYLVFFQPNVKGLFSYVCIFCFKFNNYNVVKVCFPLDR